MRWPLPQCLVVNTGADVVAIAAHWQRGDAEGEAGAQPPYCCTSLLRLPPASAGQLQRPHQLVHQRARDYGSNLQVADSAVDRGPDAGQGWLVRGAGREWSCP